MITTAAPFLFSPLTTTKELGLAKANPGLLKLGGEGAWPTVTLLK